MVHHVGMAVAAAALMASAHASRLRRAHQQQRAARRTPQERSASPSRWASRNGQAEILAALRLELQAADAGVRLEQVCVLDHSTYGYRPRHLHLQCHFDDGSVSSWLNVNGTYSGLREAVHVVQPGHRVRLHLHDDPEETDETPEDPTAYNGGPASPRVVDLIPKLTLDERSAGQLAADSIDACPFCLDGFEAGSEVLVMPCAGTHVAHAACSHEWFKLASTCPSCRFMLPKAASMSALQSLVAAAQHEMGRIRDALPPPCQPVDEEDDEEGTLGPAASISAPSWGIGTKVAALADSADDDPGGKASFPFIEPPFAFVGFAMPSKPPPSPAVISVSMSPGTAAEAAAAATATALEAAAAAELEAAAAEEARELRELREIGIGSWAPTPRSASTNRSNESRPHVTGGDGSDDSSGGSSRMRRPSGGQPMQPVSRQSSSSSLLRMWR